jgi:uncharacterized protein
MQKRVFIIHGWDGSPQNCWFPWLKNELEKKGFTVQALSMPHPENPTIEDWVQHLSSIVGKSDGDTYFVGHSIGCQTILRYVERLPKPVGGIVCVAGFFRLPHLVTKQEKEIAKPWLESEVDYNRVKQNAHKVVAIFSDNDPNVDLRDKDLFEERLDARTVVEHKKGHFGDSSIKELPSALDAVLEIAGE